MVVQARLVPTHIAVELLRSGVFVSRIMGRAVGAVEEAQDSAAAREASVGLVQAVCPELEDAMKQVWVGAGGCVGRWAAPRAAVRHDQAQLPLLLAS